MILGFDSVEKPARVDQLPVHSVSILFSFEDFVRELDSSSLNEWRGAELTSINDNCDIRFSLEL